MAATAHRKTAQKRQRVVVLKALFLCTGNSARSIIAEVLLNELGGDIFEAYSAGSHPTGQINPGAIEVLTARGHFIDNLESKSWDTFCGEDAPVFDIVITVCDDAAGESCPVWNGSPVVAHWGIPDPAAFRDATARRKQFDRAYSRLKSRIEAFLQIEHKPRTLEEARRTLEDIHERELISERADD